ncbi:hypothetical protein [Paraflavitalea pollutisoli]|uniref:hypothetical protein n=1 Tax=Paraflavitalea pollutisoli TaxID=3034143 RepID=UPI0023EB2081|nr:hypothetical protein [Paraflavitalea sp. H1-2-19X]
MARFEGIPIMTGTIGPVCIYKMFGRYYMRTSNPLSGDRVKKDPAFQKTMQYAALLSRASRIASSVYASLPARRRQHTLYRKLTGEAMTWLKYQWKDEEIVAYLIRQYGQPVASADGVCMRIREQFKRTTRQGAMREDLLHEPPAEKVCWQQYACQLLDRATRRAVNASVESYAWAEYVEGG